MRKSIIAAKDAYPYIASWNGSDKNTTTGLKVSATLRAFVAAQMGPEAAALFEEDFINYNKGYILCLNVPVNLINFFGPTIQTSDRNFRKTLTFTKVAMPSTFIGQKGNLSKNYEYGEQLVASVSFEKISQVKIAQTPYINNSSVQQSQGPLKSKNGAGKQYLSYRDSNISARTLKSQSGGGGGGIGVWS